MKKILVIPKDLNNLGKILKKDINGIILPIKDLSVNFTTYFTIEDIKDIINLTSKEICVIINKTMHKKDLPLLEETLIKLNKLNITKIIFYDLAVLNLKEKLNISKELVIYQEHLNASSNSNQFYQKRNVKYSIITNDITKDEINEISKNNRIMLISYGYLPIFYSKRHLITNYLEHINEAKEDVMYYIKANKDRYPILEEKNGTTIYTKEPINLINEINNINVDYIILNAFNIEDKIFIDTLDNYLENKKEERNLYTGFLNKKTVYNKKDYE